MMPRIYESRREGDLRRGEFYDDFMLYHHHHHHHDDDDDYYDYNDDDEKEKQHSCQKWFLRQWNEK